jgi:peptidoglycan/xylan/chitin deacetylase (PgdA/CDA1 family)
MTVLIINYHRLWAKQLNSRVSSVYDVCDRAFVQQLELIASQDFPVIVSRDEIFAAISARQRRSVLITFDDGNMSDLIAAEKLRAVGLKALFFISTAEIGKADMLSRSGVLELHSMGMEIGSHSHQHTPLVNLSPSNLKNDLVRSKAILEDLVGCPVTQLAFPGGVHNSGVVRASSEVGYSLMHGTAWGENSARSFDKNKVLRRNNILSGTGQAEYARLINGRGLLSQRFLYGTKTLVRSALPEQAYSILRERFANRSR